MTPPPGGGQTSTTGKQFENFVADLLRRVGYREIKAKSLDEITSHSEPVFVSQFPIGKGIYDTNINVDFVIYNPQKHSEPMIIECKWQETPGTTDEKLTYLVENIKTFPLPTIVLLDGGGHRPGAAEWIQNQAGPKHRLRKVYTMQQFQVVVNRGEL